MGGWDQNGPWGDWLGGVEWIHLAQNRDLWQAVMNAVMNLWVLMPQSSLCVGNYYAKNSPMNWK
jgi:hypothetical protein